MVDKIEKIENGVVKKRAVPYNRNGGMYYECFEPGATRDPLWFSTLDEVANFLQEKPNRRVRMEPGSAMTSKNIHIDGYPLCNSQNI